MPRLIRALADIAAPYDALYCDLWGCLHDGLRPFPEAVAALRAFRDGGGAVVLLTNSPRPSPLVTEQLDHIGVPREAYDIVASSGDAAQEAMFAGAVGRRVWHLGPDKDAGFFDTFAPDVTASGGIDRVTLDEAEGIVCTGPLDEGNDAPEDYRPVFLKAKTRGLKLLCANPDLVVDKGERRIYCAGALAALYEEMGGESLYYGKPHPPIYDLASRRLEALTGRRVPADRILAIGDGIATDIQGAMGEDIDALFVTGGIAAEETGTAEEPDPERLRAFLDSHGLSPLYAIARLR